jgi:hypothetical protein
MNDIRNVMESIFYGIDDKLSESQGLTNRKPMDIFKNDKTGEVIKFIKILEKITISQYVDVVGIDEVSSNILSIENLKVFIDAWVGEPIEPQNINIIPIKSKLRPTDILMVAVFEDMNGAKRVYVKIGRGSSVSWGNVDFGKETDFFLQKKSSVSEKMPIKISDVFPRVDKNDKSNITMTMEKFVEGVNEYMGRVDIPKEISSGVINLLSNLMSDENSSGPIVIPGCADHISVFEKYIGEMIAPICLYKNKNIISPDTPMEEIYKDFGSNGNSFSPSSSTIKIYRGTNTRLIDTSIKDSNGNIIGISSKSKSGGADASIDVLYDVITKMESDGMGDELIAMKQDMVIDVIGAIRNNNMVYGPVAIAEILGIFAENNALELLEVLRPLSSQKKLRENIEIVEKSIDIEKYQFITNHKFKPNTASPGYLKTFHIISVLVRIVCEKMNKEHNVGDHIKKLLSRKSLIQVYSNFSKSRKDNSLIFNNIKVTYPAKLPRNIEMSSKKPYSASHINGKITFTLLRN